MGFGHLASNSVRELWILDGPNWKLPAWVKTPNPNQSEVELRLGAGLPLLESQRETGGAFLDGIGTRKGTRWIVNREILTTVARRLKHCHPEECVVWTPTREWTEQGGTLRFGRDVADEFCKSFFHANYCQRLQDVSEVVYMFNAFCKHAFNWVLNLQRPLDLVFCVIHPVPYRIDWRAQAKGNWLDPQLLDYDPDKEVIRWGLELQPTEVWYGHVAKMEAQRKLEKGDGYWASVLDMIKRQSAHLKKLRAHYKAQAAHPSAPLPPQWVEERGGPVPGGGVPVSHSEGNGVPVQPLHGKAGKGKHKSMATAH